MKNKNKMLKKRLLNCRKKNINAAGVQRTHKIYNENNNNACSVTNSQSVSGLLSPTTPSPFLTWLSVCWPSRFYTLLYLFCCCCWLVKYILGQSRKWNGKERAGPKSTEFYTKHSRPEHALFYAPLSRFSAARE